MLFLRSWLEDYIDLSHYSNDQIKHVLTYRSGEVEEVRQVQDYFDKKLVIGKIQDVRKHPQADKLKIFTVNLGASLDSVQIVSAAPNVENDLVVPVALIGCKLPYLTIAERKLRGETSYGMCCGKNELLIQDSHDHGLWELNSELESRGLSDSDSLGKSIGAILPEFFPTETIFDIKYLADKLSACGSHLGLALELAICLENKDLLTQKAQELLSPTLLLDRWEKVKTAIQQKPALNFNNSSDYARLFLLYEVLVESVDFLEASPIPRRMFLTERNLIGGLADISNYLLYDVGQPTHFFSSAKIGDLTGQTWTIEKTTKNESFEGLGQLKSTTIPVGVDVLKQADKILTLPGISGSQDSKVDYQDNQILVEIANFPGEKVASNSFTLEYRSDGSKFWASGVREALSLVCLVRMIDILPKTTQIFQLIDYSKSEGSGINYLHDQLQNTNAEALTVDLGYICKRIDGRGLEYWKDIVIQKLELLGTITQQPDGVVSFISQPFYSFIVTQEDLLDQIIRLIGFDDLEPENLSIPTGNAQSTQWTIQQKIKDVVSQYGFNEIISRPFVGIEDTLENLKKQEKSTSALQLQNPHNIQQNYLQNSLLPSLLQAGVRNILKGKKQIKLFESTLIYSQNGQELVENWKLDLLGVLDDPYVFTSLFRELGLRVNTQQPTPELSYQPISDNLGKGFSYQFGTLHASLYQLSSHIKRQFSLPLNKNIWYLSINLDNVTEFNSYNRYRNESPYPSIKRSYSFQAPRSIHLDKLLSTAQAISLEDTEVRIIPLERIKADSATDYILFEIEFVSYTQTLENHQVQEFEKRLLEYLQKVDSQISLRS